jgi:FkbM family methyltransferase
MRLKLRSGTIDSIVFEAIFKYDEYKLPEKFSKDDVILDIGAHIGLFTYAVVQRGSQHIYAFEADAENYTIALENLKHYIDQGYVSFKRSAVWRSDISENALYHSGYFTDNNIINTGGGDVLWQKQGISVPALSFDTVVRDVTFQAQRRIRLLKLDCEGSEWPILFTSKTLHLVDLKFRLISRSARPKARKTELVGMKKSVSRRIICMLVHVACCPNMQIIPQNRFFWCVLRSDILARLAHLSQVV